MPILVAIHRLKDFDEWIKLFKTNPPPQSTARLMSKAFNC